MGHAFIKLSNEDGIGMIAAESGGRECRRLFLSERVMNGGAGVRREAAPPENKGESMCEEKKELCKIGRLVGERVNYIGRAANMLDLHFGEDVVVTTRRETRTVGTYILHVQCPWRIINVEKRGMYLGSMDFYAPSNQVKADKNFRYETFDWDVRGQNLFDEKAPRWFAGLEGVTVTEAKLYRFGDARIKLSNGDWIEIFATESADRECWRLFQYEHDTEDLIVNSGTGVQR